MKVFISQPMKDRSAEDIRKEREEIMERLRQELPKICHMNPKEEIELMDTFFEDYNPKGKNVPLKHLAKSIEMLADADVAFFATGWEKARGCKIENTCAIEYGITVIEDYKRGA